MLFVAPTVRRVSVCAAMLLLMLAGPLTASAAPQRVIDRARAVLSARATGVDVLSFMHFGSAYHGHTLTKPCDVRGEPDDFALVYRYDWGDDGVTDLAILCDRTGSPYEVQVVRTNAVLNQPFVLAGATMQIVGNLILEGYGEKMTDNEKATVRQLIEKADAKRLLVWYLQLRLR